MDVPSPWITLILIAAAFRIWRLLADDAILDGPRRRFVRLPRNWEEGQRLPDGYRLELAKFISCPWCLGFWISICLWMLWLVSHHWTAVFCVPWALSAGVGIVRGQLDPPE